MGILTGHLMELGKDEAVQERVLEVARQFFSNSNITVNLLPALIAGDCDVCVCLFLNYLVITITMIITITITMIMMPGGLLLLAIPLLLLFFPGLFGGGSTDATGSG